MQTSMRILSVHVAASDALTHIPGVAPDVCNVSMSCIWQTDCFRRRKNEGYAAVTRASRLE